MTIKTGERIPSIQLKTLGADGMKTVSTDDLFKGKKVVLFALPGAFTPTCSMQHLPGFVKNADKLRAKGVDTIACLSVNDAFVMDAWGRDQKVGDKVLMLADGNADFSKAVGLTEDDSEYGMGIRACRYALVAENGVVKTLAVEEGDAFDVSSAESILAKL
ncbi:MAG: peroxiredoxin [Dongiaceae bacterium]